MKILILHHSDADGRCAAAVAAKAMKGADIVFREMDYGDPFPLLPKQKYDHIFVLDFSFPPEDMARLVVAAQNPLLWIDHHITAIEKLKDFERLEGIRRDGTAACMLAWEWFFPHVEPPWAVKYIADRDVWKLEYGDDTHFFYEMFTAAWDNPQFFIPKNDTFWEYVFNLKDVPLHQFKCRGRVLRKVRIQQLIHMVDALGYEAEIDGHTALKLNAPGSGDLGDVMRIWKFPIAWCYVEKMQHGQLVRKNSLYSNTVDVSEIALARGGGGHRGAAGFVEVVDG